MTIILDNSLGNGISLASTPNHASSNSKVACFLSVPSLSRTIALVELKCEVAAQHWYITDCQRSYLRFSSGFFFSFFGKQLSICYMPLMSFQWSSTEIISVPSQETSGNVWTHICLSWVREYCSCQLMGRGEECC